MRRPSPKAPSRSSFAMPAPESPGTIRGHGAGPIFLDPVGAGKAPRARTWSFTSRTSAFARPRDLRGCFPGAGAFLLTGQIEALAPDQAFHPPVAVMLGAWIAGRNRNQACAWQCSTS